mgnify:CR=1 FL=1
MAKPRAPTRTVKRMRTAESRRAVMPARLLHNASRLVVSATSLLKSRGVKQTRA